MPIVDVDYQDGILFAREVDRITEQDAHDWAQAITRYMENGPLVTVIDARQAGYIEQEARRVFVRIAKDPRFIASAVVTTEALSTQTARTLSILAPSAHTHIFERLEDAFSFAQQKIGAGVG
jgi:hypothetical protein